jgi:hypothetical protein
VRVVSIDNQGTLGSGGAYGAVIIRKADPRFLRGHVHLLAFGSERTPNRGKRESFWVAGDQRARVRALNLVARKTTRLNETSYKNSSALRSKTEIYLIPKLIRHTAHMRLIRAALEGRK